MNHAVLGNGLFDGSGVVSAISLCSSVCRLIQYPVAGTDGISDGTSTGMHSTHEHHSVVLISGVSQLL